MLNPDETTTAELSNEMKGKIEDMRFLNSARCPNNIYAGCLYDALPNNKKQIRKRQREISRWFDEFIDEVDPFVVDD